jgi:hypothetical protein
LSTKGIVQIYIYIKKTKNPKLANLVVLFP